MRKSITKNRIAAKVMVLVLMLSLLCGCNSSMGTSISVTDSVVTRNIITQKSDNVRELHYSESAKSFTENIASSGLIKLVLDKSTNSFGVYDKAGGALWSALPLEENITDSDLIDSKSSLISLRIIGGTDIYDLNSQDNSLAYGKASMETGDGKAVLTFDIFPDEETASKESYSKTDIGFRAIMEAELVDGNMKITCRFANLTGNKQAYIESADILNSFGAYNDTVSGDFIFVPDGCGAVLDTSIYDESFESLSFDVYGTDLSVSSESSGTAIIPAFGIKHSSCAFAALIEEGDAVAKIVAEKAVNLSGYNRAYSTFILTPSNYEDETLYVSDAASVDEIKICYRFLSGKNATYAGLASAVREQLIRNGVLSTNSMAETDYLPLYLTLSGTVNKATRFFDYQSVLTDFEQAKDMLVRMKNKGINMVYIRYTDIFSGGQDSKSVEKSSVLMRLGGMTKLRELYEYMSGQKMQLYLDVDILSSVDDFKNNATDISKNATKYLPIDKMAEIEGTILKERYLRNLDGLKDAIFTLLTDTKDDEFTGFCLGDAGSVLYSDFSGKGILREQASEIISDSVLPLSSNRNVMVDTGNFYLLKNVDSVINIPLSTTVTKSGAYRPVPFVQLVLHGIIDYAGNPINTAVNTGEMMLRNIEYGACPHYEWNYESIAGENDIYYYDNTINSAADFYSRADETLNDLRSARMTDHYEVSDGVFCTEYDTGAMVYTNYTDSDYSVLGVVVDAKDFTRVN